MATLAEQVQGERQARMVLSMIAEPNDPATGHVLARAGGVETLRLIESDDPLPDLARADALIWRQRLAARTAPNLPEQMAEAARLGFGTVIPADKEWPAGLDDLGDRAPYILWTRGASSFLTTPLRERVTITGSRAATPYGEHVAADIAANLAEDERVIVAGGAYGIEGAAHQGALAQGGHTIAVLAGGLDRLYPSGNRELLERIADLGLLVSELPPGAAPTRHRFLARSRLLAALSGVTVIPEASARSGSLRTATHAHALGRAVAAIPGPVTSVTSDGPHELIKHGHATIATTTSDITVLLDSGKPPRRGPARSELGQEFTYQYQTPGVPGRSI
ncbi:DNA-processing protein DprA [Amycolatopsis sacchari]|uniref:DNA-processing protein DprA n=1 Tax=Amycolatopsis TaxID=1813 RepID=UPI003D7432B0